MEEKKSFDLVDFIKKHKLVIFILVIFLICNLILFSILLNVHNSHKLKLNVVGSGEKTTLIALDSCAKNNRIGENQTADFKFSQKQKDLFQAIYEQQGSAALTLRLFINPSENQKMMMSNDSFFRIGFLEKRDFTKNGKFVKDIYGQNKRVVIQGGLIQFFTYYSEGIVDISFALPKKSEFETESYADKNVPEGFFVYSSVNASILDACITPAYVGFDAGGNIPFYGFAYNGGKLDFTNSGFDFSGGSIVFASENSSKKIMPEYVIEFSDEEEIKATLERGSSVEINFGGEKLYVNNVTGVENVKIPAGALRNSFSRMEIIDQKQGVKSILLKNVQDFDSLSAIKTDPGLILKYSSSQWRNVDYEVFEWDRFPGILIFDTRNYDVQSRFFTRMAYFVEKAGYKGTLLTNSQLEGKHGYNAHDYSAVSMAEFFNKATREGFRLNEEELLLKNILIRNGLFESDGNFVKANEGGIVSISQETAPGTRANLMAHEGWHTLFFRYEVFRNYVSAVYYTMDPVSKDFLIDYFKSQPGLGYDTTDDYLMQNEFMAYVMQQRLSEVAKYFVHHANRGSVIAYTPELAAYIRKTQGIAFEDAAVALNEFVFDNYGIVCGNIALVNRY